MYRESAYDGGDPQGKNWMASLTQQVHHQVVQRVVSELYYKYNLFLLKCKRRVWRDEEEVIGGIIITLSKYPIDESDVGYQKPKTS